MTVHSLVDIGVNLTHNRFDRDREAVIERAIQAGVQAMVLTGVDLPGSHEAAKLAAEYPDRMRSTAGVHPHHASGWSQTVATELATLLHHPMVTAVGETGLDYFRDFSPRPIQREAFAGQLEIAATHQVPVFLHQRDADADFLAVLKDFRDRLPAAVLHCFTGGRALLHACLDLDLHIGVTGWVCDERRGQALRDCVADIPLSRLMIETDAPFLLPRDLPEKPADRRNEPAYLPHVLNAVAELKKLSAQELARESTRTARAFFALN